MGVVALSLCGIFSQFSSVWCPIFPFRGHVSVVLTSSVRGMAQLFSCRVKCCIQISFLRTIFLRVITHFSRQGPAVSSRVKFNGRSHLSLDGFSVLCLCPLASARCVGPFSLCWCRGSVVFLSVFNPLTALPPSVQLDEPPDGMTAPRGVSLQHNAWHKCCV